MPGAVWAVNVSGDGRLVVAAYGDGTIRWHRLERRRGAARLLPARGPRALGGLDAPGLLHGLARRRGPDRLAGEPRPGRGARVLHRLALPRPLLPPRRGGAGPRRAGRGQGAGPRRPGGGRDQSPREAGGAEPAPGRPHHRPGRPHGRRRRRRDRQLRGRGRRPGAQRDGAGQRPPRPAPAPPGDRRRAGDRPRAGPGAGRRGHRLAHRRERPRRERPGDGADQRPRRPAAPGQEADSARDRGRRLQLPERRP